MKLSSLTKTIHFSIPFSTGRAVGAVILVLMLFAICGFLSPASAKKKLSVSISPSKASMDVGQAQLFTSNVTGGTSPYSYQWYLDNVAVSGATNATWTFLPATAGSYTVYVNVTDSGKPQTNAQSNTAIVTVSAALFVTISPGTVTLDVGQSQTFTSTVSGGVTPYSYQWYLDGSAVSGATSSNWAYIPSSGGSHTVYVKVTDSVSAVATSNTATVTVNGALSVIISPSTVTLDVGQSQTFTSTVSGGTGPYSYQWYLDGSAVSGATNSSWIYTPSASGSHTVYVKVTDSVSSVATSNTAAVTVDAALSASISPSTVALDVGQSQTFTSTVSGGTSPCSYQWYLDGAAVPSATSSAWTCTASSSGTHTVYVDVTDSATTHVTATSNTASITVNAALSATIAPSSVALDVGQSQLFTSTVSGGTSPFSYQWYLNSVAVVGATSASWTFTPTSAGSQTVYVVVTDSASTQASATSNTAHVTVNPQLAVTINPLTSTIYLTQNQTYTSSVGSTGTSPYSYHWYLNSNAVSGVTGSTWTYTPTATGTYQIYVKVTDSVGEVATSSTATLTVTPKPSMTVTISPNSATIDLSQSIPFTSSVTGGTGPYTYQWYLNGVAVPSATSGPWVFTPASPGNYQIYLNVTDNQNVKVKSNTAYVTVNSLPTVSISPSSVVIDVGQSQTFTSTTTDGTGPFSYQWYLDGATVLGAASFTWAYTPSSSGSHAVYVKITDSMNSVATSNTATVTVNGALSVSISPSSVVLDVGQSQLFTPAVSGGTSSFSYQWYLDGVAVSGATSSAWTCTASSSGTHNVYVDVTDSATTHVTATSNTASVTVSAALSVTISPSTVVLDVGQSQLFTPAVSGGTFSFSYQWYLNGVAVLSATSASWTFTPRSAGSQTVHVVVTDSVTQASATSNTAHVTVNPQLAVTISPLTSTIYLTRNQTYTSSVNGTGTDPYSYQWYLNGNLVSAAMGSTWSYTPTATGTYQIYVMTTDELGEVATSSTATLNVTPKPPLTVTISPNSATIDLSQSVPFTSSVTSGTGPYTYQWYLNGIIVPSAISSRWAFTPASTGNYQVYLNVTDSQNVTAKSNTVYATVNSLPTVAISPFSAVLHVGQHQQFTSTVSNGTSPYAYQWYLNGVPVSDATTATWTFTPSTSGSYKVCVNVTDDVGFVAASNMASINVNPALSPPVAQFTESANEFYTDVLIQFNASLSYATNGTIISYHWDFGDGRNTTGEMTSHSYAEDGNYTVVLTVTDNDGLVGSHQKTVHVQDRAPNASFTSSSITVNAGETITFNATSSYDPDGRILSYFWDFGDQLNATGVVVSHAYVQQGNYTVTLKVTDDDGSSKTTSVFEIVHGVLNGSLHPSFDWIWVALLIVPLSILPFAGFMLKRRRGARKNYMGFEHFDEITSGGIPDSSSVLVIGGPGSGKSILCEELAYSFLFKDRSCLYVAYDSFPDEIRESLKRFGQETRGYEDGKQLLFMDCYSSNASVKSKEEYSLTQPFSLTDLGITLTEATEEMGNRLRVILDSIVPLLTHVEPSKVIEFLQDRSARIKGINGIFVFTAGKETIDPSLANRLEEAVDCIIELEVSADTGKTVRKLRVKKMRGRKPLEKWVQFKIDPSKGIVFSA